MSDSPFTKHLSNIIKTGSKHNKNLFYRALISMTNLQFSHKNFRNRSQGNCTNRRIPIPVQSRRGKPRRDSDPIACAQGLWFSYDTAPGAYGSHTPITSRQRERPDLHSVNAYPFCNIILYFLVFVRAFLTRLIPARPEIIRINRDPALPGF